LEGDNGVDDSSIEQPDNITGVGRIPPQTKFADIPWLRFCAEGVAIVVSILLAFAIEAWWQRRADTDQEHAFLTALIEDIHSTRLEFERIQSHHQLLFSALESILTWCEAGEVPISDKPRFDATLSHVFYRPTFDPPMGTVSTILGSGRLDLLSNQELAAELTRWSSLVEDLQELEKSANDHFYQTLYPYLASRVNLQDMDKAIPWEIPWPQGPTNAHPLVAEQEFHNVIYMHWVLHKNVMAWSLPNVSQAIKRLEIIAQAEMNHF
jgi:hypothetical protein